MDGWNSDNNFGVGGDGSCTVEFSDELFEGGDSSVGLPVTTDEVSAGVFGGGGAGGGAGGAGAGGDKGHGREEDEEEEREEKVRLFNNP